MIPSDKNGKSAAIPSDKNGINAANLDAIDEITAAAFGLTDNDVDEGVDELIVDSPIDEDLLASATLPSFDWEELIAKPMTSVDDSSILEALIFVRDALSGFPKRLLMDNAIAGRNTKSAEFRPMAFPKVIHQKIFTSRGRLQHSPDTRRSVKHPTACRKHCKRRDWRASKRSKWFQRLRPTRLGAAP